MKKNYFIIYLCFFTTITNAQISTKHSLQELDSIVALIKETYEVPGLAVGIVLDKKLYYSGAKGVQDLNTKSPLTTQSLYHMASVSKPFVATAIMQLVGTGKMSLEDKLVEHLPYFKMQDQRYKDITIKQILNHSSGIPDVEDYEWDKPQVDDGAAERYAKSFTKDSLDFEPGTNFSYSNASFDIMANVIAKVSGLTFEAYMKKHIFEPAGMKNTTFFKPEVPASIATAPHGLGPDLQMEQMKVYPYNRIHAPSSTLHSNIEDLTRWALLNLNQGTLDGQEVFPEATYTKLTTPTIKAYGEVEVCLSWFTQELEGKRFYFHSGGDEGYRTFFSFFPEEGAAIFLMGNNEGLQSKAFSHLFKLLLTDEPVVWKKYIHMELKNLILTEGIDSCKAFYKHAAKNLKEQYEFGAGYMDNLGYWLLDRAKHQQALEIFLFNVELNPKEAGFYDSVGDAYRVMKKDAKAIEWYKKALELNPEQDFTIRKLKEMGE